MKKKNINAFTLVELLAVIVILAVILVIAVPQVLDVIDSAKVGSLESTAKIIADAAEKKYAEYLALGKDTSSINCNEVSKLNSEDYGTCTISFDSNGKATVTIKGKENGKFDGLSCSGTRNNMVCGDIPPLPVINCSFTPGEEDLVETKVYTVKDYNACMTNLENVVINEWGMTNEDLDGICKGTGDISYGDSTQINIEWIIAENYFTEQELIDLNVINVEEIDVYEYVNGQYTYRYGQEYGENDWYTTGINGWGVTLTDKESTEDITSEVCTYINEKPIVSMSGMFANSNATLVDLSSFNTSNVTNMSGMFYGTGIVTKLYDRDLNYNVDNFNLISNLNNNLNNYKIMQLYTLATTNGILDLSNFDTSNVINMSNMFYYNRVTNLDLSSFDTSNVTDMSGMFSWSAATSLDLSSFDTSNVTIMIGMFSGSKATSLDLSNFDTSNVTSVDSMFCNAACIDTIDISHFDLSKASDASSILACIN